MSEIPAFKNQALLAQSLTHRSYVNENSNIIQDNERLEFMGDALLNFLTGEFLFKNKHFAKMNEGQLTTLRASLVDESRLAKFALQLKLDELMLLGKGAEKEGGRNNPNLLSNTFEAIIAAYYLDVDSNIEPVRSFVFSLLEPVALELLTTNQLIIAQTSLDYKSILQQKVLADTLNNPQRENPKYITIRSGGTDNLPEFTAKIYVNEQLWGEAKGSSTKKAEKKAAKNALLKQGLI